MTDTLVFAIDPGNIESGFAIVGTDYEPYMVGKVDNSELEDMLGCGIEETFNGYQDVLFNGAGLCAVVIEEVKSYGMAIGQSVIDTCVEIGRLSVIAEQGGFIPVKVPRKTYVTDLCNDPRAKDKNVIQYLIDRFAPNTPNRGKGTKKAPGWFHGFSADAWQAYAIAVWYLDHRPDPPKRMGKLKGKLQ